LRNLLNTDAVPEFSMRYQRGRVQTLKAVQADSVEMKKAADKLLDHGWAIL
jgi:hypothetical protein